jgi:hypothetical protein
VERRIWQSLADWINMQTNLEAQRRLAKRFGIEINRPSAVDAGLDYFTIDRESTTVWPILVVAALVLVACIVFAAYTLINPS